jgi:uncharacterized membrane protein YfcA
MNLGMYGAGLATSISYGISGLFVLWFFLVSIKMVAFMAVGVYIDWRFSLMLIPVAALGHFIGLRMHERMIKSDAKFKRWMGGVLIIVCMVGLLKVIVL